MDDGGPLDQNAPPSIRLLPASAPKRRFLVRPTFFFAKQPMSLKLLPASYGIISGGGGDGMMLPEADRQSTTDGPTLSCRV